MQKECLEAILKEFDRQYKICDIFADKIEKLIVDLLETRNIKWHSVNSRLKSRKSLEEKLSIPECNYTKLSDIDDISGVRIITYFSNEVDSIAKVIKEEFEVIRCEDKRQSLGPDRFGYASLHCIVKLLPARAKLTENKHFSDLKAEIQIRSVLQHAWAEIEHDLGYKSEMEVPQTIRRRFSRLAGLLEIADDEFVGIRQSSEKYKERVAEQIDKEPATVSIDNISLLSFIKNNALVKELDHKITKLFKAQFAENPVDVSGYVDKLHSVGVSTIADLSFALNSEKDLIIKFAERWISAHTSKIIHGGISLFYLCYVILGRKGSVEQIAGYLAKNQIGINEPRRLVLAGRVVELYNDVSKENRV